MQYVFRSTNAEILFLRTLVKIAIEFPYGTKLVKDSGKYGPYFTYALKLFFDLLATFRKPLVKFDFVKWAHMPAFIDKFPFYILIQWNGYEKSQVRRKCNLLLFSTNKLYYMRIKEHAKNSLQKSRKVAAFLGVFFHKGIILEYDTKHIGLRKISSFNRMSIKVVSLVKRTAADIIIGGMVMVAIISKSLVCYWQEDLQTHLQSN